MPSVTPRSFRGARRSSSNANGASSSNAINDGESSREATQFNGNKRVIRLKTRSSQRGGDTSVIETQDNSKSDKEGHHDDDDEKEEEKIQEEKKLYERWAEEYYEIVEQLPLELHRTFALMRELENKMVDKIKFISNHTITYRDVRLAAKDENPKEVAQANGTDIEEMMEVDAENSVQYDYGSSSDRDAEGEEIDEVYHELEPTTVATTITDEETKQLGQEVANSPPPTISTLASNTPKAARESLLNAIARASGEAIRAAEEKVGLAVTAYDWVDRHIRRLDADLQRSESSLLLGLRAGTEASRVVRDALGAGETDASFSRSNMNSIEDDEILTSGKKAKSQADSRMRKSETRKKRSAVDDEGNEADISTTLLTDMAIDPNEPKYCYCDEVSSGDMVACDNEDCPREWFHYHCVGLTSPPKGKWYCLFCAPPGFKGSGTFPADAPCLPPGYGSRRNLDTQGHQGNHKKKKRY